MSEDQICRSCRETVDMMKKIIFETTGIPCNRDLDVAGFFGVPRSTVSAWLRRESVPKRRLIWFSEQTGCRISELIYRDGTPENSFGYQVQDGGIYSGNLQSFIERIERLQERRENVEKAIEGVLEEARFYGHQTAFLESILRFRSMPRPVAEQEHMYLSALLGKRNFPG